MQDKIEPLFTDIYSGDITKIQQALRHQGRFTDYSGRSFNSRAYEYAYWAKDTHMCGMLEPYMDDETKAYLLARIDENDAAGLLFQQNGEENRSAHFDFTALKTAYQSSLGGYDEWKTTESSAAIKAAWLNIGRAQRDVPAHIAQEYCRTDRLFDPSPKFNEKRLPRALIFFNRSTECVDSWFPLVAAHSGLGFDFVLVRGYESMACLGSMRGKKILYNLDFKAITRLEEVRTLDLLLSREHLNPPAICHKKSLSNAP